MSDDVGASTSSKPAKRTRSAQIAAAFEAAHFSKRHVRSELADLLLSLYSWGHIPAVLVQRIAGAALRDCERAHNSCEINDWKILERLGDHGRHQNNVNRDLQSKLPPALFAPTSHLLPVRVSLRQHDTRQKRLQIPLLLPHQSWPTLVHKSWWAPQQTDIEAWWRSCGSHPALAQHPVKSIRSFQTRAVPCVLHGDAAAITQNLGSNSKASLFLSYKCLAKKGSHVLIAALWNHLFTDNCESHTQRALWTAIVESFERLFEEGCSSDTLFPVLVFSTGDLEYFSAFHGFPRWNSRHPCGLCGIQLSSLSRIREVRPLDADAWPPDRRDGGCVLFRLVSTKGVMVDWMHSKHLGTDQRYLGSTIWLLVFDLLVHMGPLEQRLAYVLQNLKVPWHRLHEDRSVSCHGNVFKTTWCLRTIGRQKACKMV